MNYWNNLSLKEKADVMKVAIGNGIYNLSDIRKAYNEYAEGGPENQPYTPFLNDTPMQATAKQLQADYASNLYDNNKGASIVLTPWKALDNIDYVAIPDVTFTKDKTGVGDIEYFSAEHPEGITYSNSYHKKHPKPGKDVILYNPITNGKQDIRLDALHIMPKDATYDALNIAYRNAAKDGDVSYNANKRRNEDIKKYGEDKVDSFKQYFNNEADGLLRNMLIEGSPEYIESRRYYPDKQQLRKWNAHLMPYVEAIQQYLETGERPPYILPEVTVTPDKKSTGGPLITLANEFSKGGKIHIKPSHRGKFTRLKERTGHSASWFKENGTPAQKKMATFELNARKWKYAEGGPKETNEEKTQWFNNWYSGRSQQLADNYRSYGINGQSSIGDAFMYLLPNRYTNDYFAKRAKESILNSIDTVDEGYLPSTKGQGTLTNAQYKLAQKTLNQSVSDINSDDSDEVYLLNVLQKGTYYPKEHTILYSPYADESDKIHERTHAAEAQFIKNAIRNNKPKLQNGVTSDRYLDNPSEIYSRLNSFRFENKLNPTDTVDRKKLEDFKKSAKDYDLLDRYDDDSLLFLLNDVAHNVNSQSQDGYNVTALGGPLVELANRYEDGGFTDDEYFAGTLPEVTVTAPKINRYVAEPSSTYTAPYISELPDIRFVGSVHRDTLTDKGGKPSDDMSYQDRWERQKRERTAQDWRNLYDGLQRTIGTSVAGASLFTGGPWALNRLLNGNKAFTAGQFFSKYLLATNALDNYNDAVDLVVNPSVSGAVDLATGLALSRYKDFGSRARQVGELVGQGFNAYNVADNYKALGGPIVDRANRFAMGGPYKPGTYYGRPLEKGLEVVSPEFDVLMLGKTAANAAKEAAGELLNSGIEGTARQRAAITSRRFGREMAKRNNEVKGWSRTLMDDIKDGNYADVPLDLKGLTRNVWETGRYIKNTPERYVENTLPKFYRNVFRRTYNNIKPAIPMIFKDDNDE